MTLKAFKIFLECTVVATLTACAGIDANQTESATFKEPLNLEEFIANMKSGIETGAFLRQDFSSDDNLTSVFGELFARRVDNTPNKKYIELKIRSPSGPGAISCAVPDAIFSWWWEGVGGHRHVRITAAFRVDDPNCEISVDLVEKLFGIPTKVTSFFGIAPPPPHRNLILRRPTHRLGNTDIQFQINGTRSTTNLEFEVLGDGVIRSFGLSQEDK